MSLARWEKSRRGVALMAVLIVVTIGALVGTTLLYAAEAGRESAAAAMRVEKSRLLAWSGVQAVVAELAGQREALLAGEPASVTGSWVFASEEGSGGTVAVGTVGGYRLRVVGESTLVSEAGKLDVNHASEEMLAKLPGVGEAIAKGIVSARASRAFASVHDLLGVEGIDEAALLGSGERAETGVRVGGDAGVGVGEAEDEAGGLSRFVTVFSFDPNVQVGLGDRGAEFAGDRRLNLNVEWSEELGKAMGRRFGEGAAEALKELMGRGITFAKDRDIVAQLRALEMEPAEWGEVLDALCTTDAEYLLGRVDLMSAPAEVLACVPGIDADRAAQIVARRGKIEGDLRTTATWPVVDGILTEEQFLEAVDHLTVRSMQWRVVVEAGTVVSGGAEGDEGEEGLPPIGGPGGGDDDGSGGVPEGAGLADAVVLEAVIDVSSLRARVAYLRDVTMLPLARVVERRVRGDEASEEPEPTVETVTVYEDTRPVEIPVPRSPLAPPLVQPAPRAGRTPVKEGAEGVPGDEGPMAPEVPEEKEAVVGDGRIGRWTTRSGERR